MELAELHQHQLDEEITINAPLIFLKHLRPVSNKLLTQLPMYAICRFFEGASAERNLRSAERAEHHDLVLEGGGGPTKRLEALAMVLSPECAVAQLGFEIRNERVELRRLDPKSS